MQADVPILKIYEDEDGNSVSMMHIAGLPVACFDFPRDPSHVDIKYYEKVMTGCEVALKEQGLDQYYVLVGSQKDYDFARWMGYEITGQHIKDTKFEVLGKVI